MPTTRMSAEERRETIIDAAMELIAQRGFDATPTLAIAKGAGISHAYLFRLFPSKDDLVVAVVQRCNARVAHVMQRAASEATAADGPPLEAMGKAYTELLEDRDVLLVQLHAHAASATMPAVREAMRASFAELTDLTQRVSGADSDEIRGFFAQGMLCNVIAALDLYGLDTDWARVLTGGVDAQLGGCTATAATPTPDAADTD
ncbi:TetR/AcrR family transcriptional regulator [Patulibacter minatonensis]|uniref:TetR/AcrR family transcriptional regulator n=1 Tax=Patulibacter minatonensis TaxID=298163 RepID=UPI0006881166|nr:TetR/AcrR family transcriptional regulator [Patulibacter minatonensis]